jgi:hypothetical protein
MQETGIDRKQADRSGSANQSSAEGKIMRRQRVFLVMVALLALVASVGPIAWLISARDRQEVSLTTLAQVRPGMSEADVSAILGHSTTDRTDRPPARVAPPGAGGRLLEYAGERATAVVEFDADGRVVRAQPVEVRQVTGLERLRLRLNWW